MKTLNKQLGSILIEALIALVVLGLGIVAIAKLQGSLVKVGAEAQARNVALQLAQQKMDDLRAYNILSPATVTMLTSRPYALIQGDGLYGSADTGGSILWNSTTVGNAVYDMGWKVDDYPASFYKAVTMTVSWTPPGSASAEHANLTSYIAKLDAYGQKLLGGGLAASPGPQVIYNPGAAPDVIAIDTDGETTETTLPEPAIKKIASTDYFYSQFETVTYTGGNVELRNEEFLNIRCECEYGNNHIGLGFPVARSIWHPSHDNDIEEHAHYVASFFHPAVNDHAFIAQAESGRADFLGEMITKVVGQSAAGASSQHPFCNTCCRDHHDGDQAFLADENDPGVSGKTDDEVTGAYACKPDTDFAVAGNAEGDRSKCADPWRPTDDYDSTTGDHKHYTAAGVEVVPGANGTYLEACRLKRINGQFSVFQDWHLHGSTYVAVAADAFDPDATGNKFDEYRQYIKDYVEAVITSDDNLPVTNIVNPATSFVWPPSGFIGYPTSKQFIARGIYMDYLDSYTLDRLNEIVGTASFFENAPFNEINLTRLTDWQPQCVKGDNPNRGSVANSTTGKIGDGTIDGSCVTNYGINLAGDAESIRRGKVLLINNDPFALNATMLLSNTGVIGINTPLAESSTATLYPTSNDRSFDNTSVRYTENILGSVSSATNCTAIIAGAISQGTSPGAKAVSNTQVKIFSTPPGGECSKTATSSGSGTYSCNTGSQQDNTSVSISGNNVSDSSSVSINCASAVSGIVTITGPNFTTN